MTIDKSTIGLRKSSITNNSWLPTVLISEKSSVITNMNANKIPAKTIPKKFKTKHKHILDKSKTSLIVLDHLPSNDYTSPRYYVNRNNNLSASHYRSIVITTVILVLFIYTQPSNQDSFCPKVCSCGENNLDIICNQDYGASTIPHTLNPGAKRIIINNAQVSQFTQLDYLNKLETLDLAHNKLTMIDFHEIGGTLVSLNTSHNIIVELKDSDVSKALSEHGLTASMFRENGDLDALKTLKKLVKIDLISFVASRNHLDTIKDLTFMRWHKLHRLDLSFNLIYSLEPLSLFGLNKLEFLDLRGNRLRQVPTVALHSTMSSMSPLASMNSSTIKYLDLSQNALESIQPDSFSMLEKTQELILESCSLKSINERAFKGLHTLNLLSLDKNNLSEVPSRSFSYLPSLRILKFNSNSIISLSPESFSALVYLEELQMNYATFGEIQQGVFDGLDLLKRLDVACNPNLTMIEFGVFDKLNNLVYLNLSLDSLISLPEVHSKKLSTLDLRGNPLNCGCDLKWLTRWLRKTNETSRSNQLTNSTLYDIQKNHMVDNQISMTSLRMTNELHNLTCSGPPALVGKVVAELPENKLECLKPNSDLNVHIGFVTLFVILFLLIFVCLINFCRNRKHLFFILKENLVRNNITMMMPYNENLHKNVDDLKKETQLYNTDYESVDYNQRQVYSVNGDQVLYYEPQQYSQHI